MISAVFFPIDPEALVFDLHQQALAAMRAGLKLYTNGQQFALLPRPMKGWVLFKGATQCAA